MGVSELAPYLLGGGGLSILLAALRWGRQDARDAVEMASSNSTTAMALRDDAMEDSARLKVALIAMQIENARLLAILRAAGIDPGSPS